MATVSDNNVILRLLLKSDEYKKGLKTAGKQTNTFEKSVGKLKVALTGVIAVQLIRSMGNLAIKTEQTKVSFETFLGSAQKAKQVLKELNEFSLKTPFTPVEVNDAGKALLAFGVNADKLIPTLGAIGDLSAGTGKNFNELAVIFGKAKVQGTLFAEDINQLTEAGIPIIDEFAKQLKVSTGEVKKLGSQGKISFDNLEQAFKDMTGEGGKFFELTSKQSQTLGGLISTLQGTFTSLSNTFTERFLPTIKNAVKFVTGLVDTFKDFIAIDVVTEITNERDALNLLVIGITSTNTAQEDRIELIEKLQKDYPSFLKNLDIEKVTNEQLAERLGLVNEQYIKKIALAKEDLIVDEKRDELGETVSQRADTQLKLQQKLIDINFKRNLGLTLTGKNLLEQTELVTNALEKQEALDQARRGDKRGDVDLLNLGALDRHFISLLQLETKAQLELNDAKGARNAKGDLITGEDFTSTGKTPEQLAEAAAVALAKKKKELDDKAFRAGAKARKKARNQAEQDEIKAFENIQDLTVGLITDDETRSIAAAELAAERTIGELIGTEDQIKKQAELIRKILKGEISEIRESFQILTTDQVETQIFEEKIITQEAKKFLDKIQKEIDAQETLKIDIKPVFIEPKPEDFSDKLGNLFDPDSEANKGLRDGLDALQSITSSLFSADDSATKAKLENIETQISASENSIKRATESGKEGADQVIEIEEAKIERLEKARKESLEAQQRQAKIESALAATSSLVNAVPLVLKLFKKGGLVGGLAGIAAVIGSIATLRSAIKTPTFHTGTTYADETGTSTGGKLKKSEFMAKLEKGEMVIPKGDSARLRSLGLKHSDILALAENSREGRVVALSGNNNDSRQIIETNNRLIEQNDKIINYMRNLKTEVKIDERGLSIRQMSLQKQLKKRR